MKEQPILFNSENVRAILEDRKTQTRRVMKRPPTCDHSKTPDAEYKDAPPNYVPDKITGNLDYWHCSHCGDGVWLNNWKGVRCPFGQVGDRLWVRETFSLAEVNWRPKELGRDRATILYKAGGTQSVGWNEWLEKTWIKPDWDKTRSSRFMNKDFARIWLEITGVRVERLQEITFDDMLAEGARYPVTTDKHRVLRITGSHPPSDYIPKKDFKPKSFSYIGTEENWLKAHFAGLWDDLNFKRGYGWDKNPWCWVIEFRRLTDAPH